MARSLRAEVKRMKAYSLNGDWKLRFYDEQLDPAGSAAKEIPAVVPGNVEIDLMRAGILPDIFFGNNVKLLRPYEFCHWTYARAFEAPALRPGERAFLHFRGVDCVAAYFLNGAKIGSSKNALIGHRFEVTEQLRPGENALAVELSSPILFAAGQEAEARATALPANYESLRLRKPPSCYGWDIMPRTVSAGLWRDVLLEIEGEDEIEEVYFATLAADKRSAQIACHFAAHTSAPHYAGLALRLRGSVGGKGEFSFERKLSFPQGRFTFALENPLLWMPRGYGEANVYDVKVELLREGKAVAEYHTSFGVRTVKLVRTDTVDAHGGDFHFEINGVPVFCMGSNWVPADALHSRDAGRYASMLELWRETNSNILRCWGGNVYEDHAFFDLCDRQGIMVWQDFSMACALYPMDEGFLAEIRAEAEHVVRKLRNHPSIILWSGDNEIDEFSWGAGVNPGDNRITREVLPQVVARHDPYRPYLPSSPYIAPAVWRAQNLQLLPEDHLWGPRDYYKGRYYTSSPACFVSETGYHGCNSLSSIKGFISPDKLWPWQGNDEWLTHAAEMDGPDGPYAYRIQLMADQIHEMFGCDPDNLPDFILASQISQAEAKKYFIERFRLSKWRRTGIIWWNLIDGWPQISDAIVDYYLDRKLAYSYIRRSQKPFCLMFDEPEDRRLTLYAVNDTRTAKTFTYTVTNDRDHVILAGSSRVGPDESAPVASIPATAEKRYYLIRWDDGEERGLNHYFANIRDIDLAYYQTLLDALAE